MVSILGPRRLIASHLVWESEEWLKEHVKPLAQSGGRFHALRPNVYSLTLTVTQVSKDDMRKAQSLKTAKKTKATTKMTPWKNKCH